MRAQAESLKDDRNTVHICDRARHAGTRWQMDLPQLSSAGRVNGAGEEKRKDVMMRSRVEGRESESWLEMEERSEGWKWRTTLRLIWFKGWCWNLTTAHNGVVRPKLKIYCTLLSPVKTYMIHVWLNLDKQNDRTIDRMIKRQTDR